MLVKPHTLFATALNMRYAIGAFNTSNLELSQAIIWAAVAQNAPVIVQTSEGALTYGGLPQLAAIISTLAQEATVPVVLHLDHGKNIDTIKACINAGFTSVMIDASGYELSKNIERSREVVTYAKARGVWIEAELGAILGAEGAHSLTGRSTPEAMMTRPQDVAKFVDATGVNALAVSVGTIHGAFTGQEYIRFELLEKIQEAVPHLPLVVHGASGIAEKHLAQVATTNVCKINVDTELRLAMEAAVRAYLAEPHDNVDIREMLGAGREAVQAAVAKKIEVFGSKDKARL